MVPDEPPGSVVVQLAASVEPSTRLAEHKVLPSELKVTDPVGVPAPGACAATVPVRVTLCPATGVEGLVVTLVAVEAGDRRPTSCPTSRRYLCHLHTSR